MALGKAQDDSGSLRRSLRNRCALLAIAAALIVLNDSNAAELKPCAITKKQINRYFALSGFGARAFDYSSLDYFRLDKFNGSLYADRVVNGKIGVLYSNGKAEFRDVGAEGGWVLLGRDGKWILHGNEQGDRLVRGVGLLKRLPNERYPINDVQGRFLVREYVESGNAMFKVIDFETATVRFSQRHSDATSSDSYLSYVESTGNELYLLFVEAASKFPRFWIVVLNTETWKVSRRQSFAVPESEDARLHPFLIDVRNKKVMIRAYPAGYFERPSVLSLALSDGAVTRTLLKRGGIGSHFIVDMSPSACKQGGGQILPSAL